MVSNRSFSPAFIRRRNRRKELRGRRFPFLVQAADTPRSRRGRSWWNKILLQWTITCGRTAFRKFVLPLLTEQDHKTSGEYDLQWRGTMMTPRVRYIGLGIGALTMLLAGKCLTEAPASEAPGDYLGPVALAVAENGETLYVACADAGQLLFVDLLQEVVIRRIDLPGEPIGIVRVPGDRLAVTCAAPTSNVVFLDALSGSRRGIIPTGHTSMAPVLSSDGLRMFVCNRFSNDVSVIDVERNREIARVPVEREPIAAALVPGGASLLVANHLPNMRTNVPVGSVVAPVITVVDTEKLVTRMVLLPSGASSVRGLCIAPDGRHAFVTHILSNFENIPFRVDMGWTNVNVVSVIDLEKMEVERTIGIDELSLGAGNPWNIGVTAGGDRVCVTQSGIHSLVVIRQDDLLSDLARRTMSPLPGAWPVYPSLGESLWQRIQLPGKGPRALAIFDSRVFIAEYFSDTVTVVDVDPPDGDPRLLRTLSLGPRPRPTKERLGEIYFHDATICRQCWQSCASCHPDGRADALSWDLMNDGVGNFKNTKSMLLSHETPPSMAEGVRPTAERAVRSGLIHILFTQGREEEAEAMDAYLRSLEPVPSPHLEDGQLSELAVRGRELFFSTRIGCDSCHPTPHYTDLKLHVLVDQDGNRSQAKLDTPTLIEVWRTAPYLHDGRYLTVHELLSEGRHGLSHLPQDLSEDDINALTNFVLSL
jgi:YVTN family beta-propeller protein